VTILQQLLEQDQPLEGSGRWYHGSVNSSLVYDAEKDLFYWNSKSLVGTAYTWVTKVKGLSHVEAVKYLKELGSYSDTFIHEYHDSVESVVYPKLVDIFFEAGKVSDRSYWYKRGLTDETIDRFKLGHYEDWYTIPFYQDGVFKNFQLRKEVPAKSIKAYYKHCERLLFNSDILRITSKIIIAEGPCDALRLIQEGVPCISHNAGSEAWFENWFKYFIHQKEIIILYDDDKAGNEGSKKVAKNLGENRCKIYNFFGLGDKYDVVDWFNDGKSKDELLNLIEKEGKYSFQL
jgi:DNA primase